MYAFWKAVSVVIKTPVRQLKLMSRQSVSSELGPFDDVRFILGHRPDVLDFPPPGLVLSVSCVLRASRGPAAEPDPGLPSDRGLPQPEGSSWQSDAGGSESDQRLRVPPEVPAETAVSALQPRGSGSAWCHSFCLCSYSLKCKDAEADAPQHKQQAGSSPGNAAAAPLAAIPALTLLICGSLHLITCESPLINHLCTTLKHPTATERTAAELSIFTTKVFIFKHKDRQNREKMSLVSCSWW